MEYKLFTEPREVYRGPLKTRYADYDEAIVWESWYVSVEARALIITTVEQRPILTASVNLEDYGIIPTSDQVVIKDYSENQGILTWLEANGIVADYQLVPCGNTEAHLCRFLKGVPED